MPDKNELINTDSIADAMNESIKNGLSDAVHSMNANASENIVSEEDNIQDVDMSMEELNRMLQNLGVEPLTVIDQKTKSILEGEQENVSMKNITMDKDHSEKIMKKQETDVANEDITLQLLKTSEEERYQEIEIDKENSLQYNEDSAEVITQTAGMKMEEDNRNGEIVEESNRQSIEKSDVDVTQQDGLVSEKMNPPAEGDATQSDALESEKMNLQTKASAEEVEAEVVEVLEEVEEEVEEVEEVEVEEVEVDEDHFLLNETTLHETNESTISQDKDRIQESEYRDDNDVPILMEDDHNTEENLILTDSSNNNNKDKNVLRKIRKQNLRDKKVSLHRFNIKDIVAGVSSLRTKRVWNHLHVPFLAKLTNSLKRPGTKTKSNVIADVSQNLDEARDNTDSMKEENSELLKIYETEDNKNPLKEYASEEYNESIEQDKEKQNDSIEQDEEDSQMLPQTKVVKDSGKSGERRKKEKPKRLMTKRNPLFFWITATLATFMISFVLLLLVLYLRQEALDKMNMNGLSEIEQVRFSQGTVDQDTFLPWSPDPEPMLESLKIIDESANGRKPAKE